MTPFRPRSLSATSLSLYLQCPAAYRWAYVERYPFPRTADMWLGIAVHRAIERFHVDPDADILTEFSKSWRFCCAEMGREGRAHEPAMASDGISLAGLYEADPCPDGLAEVAWQTDLGLGVPVHGVYDLVHADHRLSEHKTARWSWKPERVASSVQAQLYAAAYRAQNDRLPGSITFTVLSRFPRPTLTRFVHAPDAAWADGVLDAARVALDGMAAGIFDQKCPSGTCRYPHLCEGRQAQWDEERTAAGVPKLFAGGVAVSP